MQRAFTFFQLMVVLAIIALIAALTMPVIAKARERAKIAACVSKMSQWGAAIAIYRAEHDGDGKYGTPEQMGLPVYAGIVRESLGLPQEMVFCNGISSRGYPYPVFTSHWSAREDWVEYVTTYRENSIMISDPNHNGDKAVGSIFMMTTGIGLFEGGHVKVVKRRGNVHYHTFWIE